MTEGEPGYGVGLSASAWEKRNKQLANWETSDTNREPSYLLPRRTKARVKFSKDVMFLAAVSSGDEEEVERLLTEEGVDINCRNNDGLTAIHQCCIDDDLVMLKVVVKQGGDVNGVDNEGWTPLHAAASCGYVHIVKYLLECGAFPAAINNEGQTPSDLADDYDEVVQVLQTEVNRLGIDIEDIKCEEERQMLDDAKKLRNSPDLEPIISANSATPIHVAAAKNYTTVLNVLLSIKELDINAKDEDGWTPLHAAVHWESMEAAELLIFNGANVYTKTDAGEDLDDLIDPDLEEELKELKKLNSYINPEQDQIRKRRNQVSRRTSNSLSHSNSFDNKFPGHGPIARRLSKEKLTMIDMKKEKEDLMHSFDKFDDDINLSNSPSSTPSNDNINNKGSVDLPPPIVRTNSSGSISSGSGDSNSPKNNRRKAEMSKTMLDRLNVFEVSNSISSSPAVSSPRTSTPVCSPPVNANGGSSERKKVDSSDLPRPRVSSLDPTGPLGGGGRGVAHKNRFSFQPKPVSGTGMSKTMSLDREAEHVFKEMSAAYDSVPHSRNHTPRTVVDSKDTKKSDAQPVVTPVNTIPTATPTNTPTPLASPSPPSQSDTSDNLSMDSSKDRTTSFAGQPEAKRRTVAKTKRETRRSTQPIPTDLLERISKHDQMEEHQLNDNNDQLNESTPTSSISTTVTQTRSVDSLPVTIESSARPMTTPTTSQINEPRVITPTNPQVITPTNPQVITPTNHQVTSPTNHQVITPTNHQVTSPTNHQVITPTNHQVTSPTNHQVTSPTNHQVITPTNHQVTTPTNRPVTPPTNIPVTTPTSIPSKDLLGGDNSANLSPQIPRTKSGTRRKPKEKRRSTGIPTEIDGECEIPDNLRGIISHSRSGSGDSTDSNGMYNNIIDVQGTDEHSLSASTIEYYQQEMATLKKLLSDERKKSETVMCTYQQTCAKLESKENDLSEVQTKLEEVSSVLERERSEKEQKDKKILQLEKSQKGIQELKAEIQRLKDENGALIRVVGKLSRAPITS